MDIILVCVAAISAVTALWSEDTFVRCFCVAFSCSTLLLLHQCCTESVFLTMETAYRVFVEVVDLRASLSNELNPGWSATVAARLVVPGVATITGLVAGSMARRQRNVGRIQHEL